MPGERFTEELVLSEMGLKLGKNGKATVFEQGNVEGIAKLDALLQKAGGKPAECEPNDMKTTGTGKAKPEFLLTFDNHPKTIIVIECKKSTGKHESEKRNKPRSFAVDGVLYYAKFLKQEYNVIAVAVSGTKKEKWKVSTFDWRKGQPQPQELLKGKDVLYSPENYLRLVSGEAIRKKVTLEEIRQLALKMHGTLRALAFTEKSKPIFIAGILIALNDKDFARDYAGLNSFSSLLTQLLSAIDNVLDNSDLKRKKEDIKNHFKMIGRNNKIKEIPLIKDNSLLWYISELDKKIKPMMDHADSTTDALGIFYHEFVKYSGGDGSGLGIVLTPQHLTEFMCELSGADKNSTVVDICCGSGAFLVTAMSQMFRGANAKEIKRIREQSLYGVELDDDIFTLAVANMIVRGDGKSNIYFGDCFKPEIVKELKAKKINVGLLNPPYSQKGYGELEFVEHLLDILTVGGTGVVVVPMSCAVGTKFKETRERLFKRHTLKAVFSMPDDIFHASNASSNVCVMVWEAHKTHNPNHNTFFGFYKDDGLVKVKKMGRVDKFNRWEAIKKQWLELYRELDVVEGLTAKKAVDWNDEWLCEAYMETDFSQLTQHHFEMSIRRYLSYLILTEQSHVGIQSNRVVPPPVLDIPSWKKFKISDLFPPPKLKKCLCSNAGDLSDGTDVFYVGAKKNINGVMKLVEYDEKLITKGNCIIFICDGQGSVGYSNYMNTDFIGSTTLTAGYNQHLNKHVGLFLVAILDLERPKYSYGRKYRKFLPDTEIRLPVDKTGEPDWQFMERYIKSLPYGDQI